MIGLPKFRDANLVVIKDETPYPTAHSGARNPNIERTPVIPFPGGKDFGSNIRHGPSRNSLLSNMLGWEGVFLKYSPSATPQIDSWPPAFCIANRRDLSNVASGSPRRNASSR